jgi:hypothetical protein
MSDQKPTIPPQVGQSELTDGLGLNAETVQCYLYALLDETRRRGAMYPQEADARDEDADAFHRVCKIVRLYGDQNEPMLKDVKAKYDARVRNRRA